MLFELNQENNLDQSNQSLLQLLRTSTLRQYKLFAQSNPCSVICNKYDIRFGHINWIKSKNKHAKTMRGSSTNEETSHRNLGKSWKDS